MPYVKNEKINELKIIDRKLDLHTRDRFIKTEDGQWWTNNTIANTLHEWLTGQRYGYLVKGYLKEGYYT